MRKELRICAWLIALFVAGSAASHGAILERITTYQGPPIDGVSGVIFDGKAFTVPEHAALPKRDVRTIEFSNPKQERQETHKTEGPQALTPLAKAQLEKAAKILKEYPGVSGVVLVDDGEFVYRPDGSNVYRYHFAGLVLKEEKKAWAQISVGFTEGRSRVRIVFARSIARDGTVTTLSPDAMKVGSPSEDLVFFNPTYKSISGVIPGVEVGSVVEYEYEYEYYNPEDPRLFSPGFSFQGLEPLAFSRVKVEVPKNIQFNYATRHFANPDQAKPVIAEQGDTKTYVWQVENMPPLTPEPLMPPEQDLVPTMEGSIFKDFNAVYALLRGLQETRIKRTPEIDAKVNEIIQGAATPEEKLARIYYWVQENTRYISIKGSLGAGFSGHTAEETFHNRYGDCTDKSILFTTMLGSAGIQAYPIILTTTDAGTGITEIPTLNGNHCITEVCLNNKGMYLDSTAQDFRYPYFREDDQGAIAFNAILGKHEEIPVPPPADNRRVSRLDVKLDANGNATVSTRNEYNGNIEAGIRGFWKQVREDNRKPMMSEYVNSISPGAILKDFTLTELTDLAKPVVMTMDYALPGLAIRAKKLLYLRMPTLEKEFSEVSLETRKFPIQYMTTEERALDITLELPKGFHAKWLPPPLDIKNPYVEYHAKYVEDANQKIAFTETFERLQRIVPAKDYAEYRDALDKIAEFSKKEVFLTEKD